MRSRLSPLLLLLCLMMPMVGYAQSQELKPFTESFTSTSRIERSKTSAVVDTRAGAVFLPTQTQTLWSTNPTGISRGQITMSAQGAGGILTGSSTGIVSLVNDDNGQAQIVSITPKLKTVRFIATMGDVWIVIGTSTTNKLTFISVDAQLQSADITSLFEKLKISTVRTLACSNVFCAIDTNKGIITFDTTAARTAFETKTQPNGKVALASTSDNVFAVISTREDGTYRTPAFSLSSSPAVSIGSAPSFASSPTIFAGSGSDKALVIVREKNITHFYNLSSDGLNSTGYSYDKSVTALSRGILRIASLRNEWIAYETNRNGAVYLLGQNTLLNIALTTGITTSLRPTNITTNTGAIIVVGDSTGPIVKAVNIGAFVSSSSVQSRAVIRSNKQPIEFITLTTQASTPPGTRIDYFVSNNDGRTWESITPGTRDAFTLDDGKVVRWMAVLSTTDTAVTPTLNSVTLSTTSQTGTSIADQNRRDSTRIGDINRVAQLVERFKKQEGSYPVVESSRNYPADRWEQLQELLQDAKITTSTLPTDPGKGTVSAAYEYDYISSATGDAYVLKAVLENPANKSLAKDIDGTALRVMDCTDPSICRAGGSVQ